MSRQQITDEDLRRAVRYSVAIYENDNDAMRRVAAEVQQLGRWSELALACGLVTRVVLTKVDEAEDDDGAISLWLHAAIEQITDGDAWWIEAGNDDTE